MSPFKWSTTDKPDVIINNPANSMILEIKAAEINRTEKFATGYTTRFPRVERVRPDKNWYDCLTFEEFKEMID